MPRFFFHVRGVTDIRDNEGTELPDANAAGLRAARVAANILPTVAQSLTDGGEVVLEVTNGSEVVLTMRVAVTTPDKAAQAARNGCSQDPA